MTLIACLTPDQHPVLLTDALLSSRAGRQGIMLPSVGLDYENIQSRTDFRTWGFDEKLVQLSGQVMIAWAGDQEAARRMLVALHGYIGTDPTSRIEIEGYLRANFTPDLPVVSLIVCVREGDNNTTWWHRCQTAQLPQLGTVVYAGSGSRRFLETLDVIPALSFGDANPLMRGLAWALFIGGFLLADEMYTGEPLAANFGGAYEIGTVSGGKAIKLDDFAFLFWFGESDAKGKRFNLAKIMRRYERDRQTCYNCVEFETTDRAIHLRKEEVFVWKRFLADRVIRHDEKDIPDLNTAWQVNVFCFRTGDRGCELVVSVRREEGDRPHVITFRREGKREVLVGFDTKQIEKLLAK